MFCKVDGLHATKRENQLISIDMKANKVLTGIVVAVLTLSGIFAFKNNSTNTTVTKGPEAGFAVIELFTSEGCSSCPPADELVAKIIKEDANKAVYVLGFHVDYWNNLGWKDEFSKAEYSDRQRKYASWLKLDQVYTPQIVVNGKKEFVGSSEGTLRNAIQAGLQKPANDAISFNTVHFTHDALTLQYQTKGVSANCALVIAFVQKNAQSHVKAGENSGRLLNHVNIVRNLATYAIHGQSGTENIKLPVGFDAQTWEVVSFVQNTGTGEILSAQKIVNQGA